MDLQVEVTSCNKNKGECFYDRLHLSLQIIKNNIMWHILPCKDRAVAGTSYLI